MKTNKKATLKEVTRSIGRSTERELWVRAGGRCQFDGCNRILYKSPITQELVNIAEMAHIYSFAREGPRGRGPFSVEGNGLNKTDNLILVCHDCHKTIDKQADGGRYSADLLLKWKEKHERRIAIVTGVNPQKSSYVVLYGAKIGDAKSPLQPDQANWALFPEWFPAEEKPILLDMTWEGKDSQSQYWLTEENNLRQNFERKICPLIEEGHHFSIFAIAPIPLLVRLGTLFTDKIPAQIYQCHREPKQTWEWIPDSESEDVDYIIIPPKSYDYPPVLIISLSAKIKSERIISVLGSNVSIWELTIPHQHNDFLQTCAQLSGFRKIMRRLMVQIAEKHGQTTPLSIFPAMPVATAAELGRIRMPKAEMPWIIYDQNKILGGFIKALEI